MPTCPHGSDSCKYASIIADDAVKKTFGILGVDVDHPESVEEFREDLRFGRKLHKLADHGVLALVGTIIAAVVAIITERVWR